jgi:hypothetical protein
MADTPALTAAEKEIFLNRWQKLMPEVLTWSDEEILAGLFTGM